MSFIEDRLPEVNFVILNIPVAFDSGCHGNQDRKRIGMCIFLDFDLSFHGNSYQNCSKCHISETGDILLILALKTVSK